MATFDGGGDGDGIMWCSRCLTAGPGLRDASQSGTATHAALRFAAQPAGVGGSSSSSSSNSNSTLTDFRATFLTAASSRLLRTQLERHARPPGSRRISFAGIDTRLATSPAQGTDAAITMRRRHDTARQPASSMIHPRRTSRAGLSVRRSTLSATAPRPLPAAAASPSTHAPASLSRPNAVQPRRHEQAYRLRMACPRHRLLARRTGRPWAGARRFG